jgi:hypothetical protein
MSILDFGDLNKPIDPDGPPVGVGGPAGLYQGFAPVGPSTLITASAVLAGPGTASAALTPELFAALVANVYTAGFTLLVDSGDITFPYYSYPIIVSMDAPTPVLENSETYCADGELVFTWDEITADAFTGYELYDPNGVLRYSGTLLTYTHPSVIPGEWSMRTYYSEDYYREMTGVDIAACDPCDPPSVTATASLSCCGKRQEVAWNDATATYNLYRRVPSLFTDWQQITTGTTALSYDYRVPSSQRPYPSEWLVVAENDCGAATATASVGVPFSAGSCVESSYTAGNCVSAVYTAPECG